MCRAAVEAALESSGNKGDNLYERIEAARAAGKLTDLEAGLAHASRLATRGAIHRGELLDLSEIPSMLVAAIRVMNKLYP
jgi:hypothetical protein